MINKKFDNLLLEIPIEAKRKILAMEDYERAEKILMLTSAIMNSDIKAFIGNEIRFRDNNGNLIEYNIPESIIKSTINYGNLWNYLESLKYNNIVIPDGSYISKYITSVNKKHISDYKIKPNFTYKFFDKGFFNNKFYQFNSMEEIYESYISIVNNSLNSLSGLNISFSNEKISEIFEKLFKKIGNTLGSDRDLNDCYFLNIGNNIQLLGGEEDSFILWMLEGQFNSINAETINSVFINYIDNSIEEFEKLYNEFYQEYYPFINSDINLINKTMSFIERDNTTATEKLFLKANNLNKGFEELIENRGSDFSSMALANALLKTFNNLLDNISKNINTTPINSLSTVRYYEFIIVLSKFFNITDENDERLVKIKNYLKQIYDDCINFREFYAKFIKKFKEMDIENKFVLTEFKEEED